MTDKIDSNYNSLVIDSSVFISAWGKADKFTNISEMFLSVISNYPHVDIIMPTIVIAETITNLGKQGNININAINSHMLNFNLENLDSDFLKKYPDFTQRSLLKTSDLIIAATTNLHQATLITWDKQHLSPKQTLCQAISPAQFLEAQT